MCCAQSCTHRLHLMGAPVHSSCLHPQEAGGAAGKLQPGWALLIYPGGTAIGAGGAADGLSQGLCGELVLIS